MSSLQRVLGHVVNPYVVVFLCAGAPVVWLAQQTRVPSESEVVKDWVGEAADCTRSMVRARSCQKLNSLTALCVSLCSDNATDINLSQLPQPAL